MTPIPRPAGPAGQTAGRSGAMWMAAVLAGLAAVRPPGTGPRPASALHAASPEGGAGR